MRCLTRISITSSGQSYCCPKEYNGGRGEHIEGLGETKFTVSLGARLSDSSYTGQRKQKTLFDVLTLVIMTHQSQVLESIGLF